MASNAEEERFSDDEEERKKRQRPPSSYGSMKSDSDEMKEDGSETAEDVLQESQCDQEVAGVFNRPAPVLPRGEEVGVQLNRPASPETLYSRTTMQTKPPGALVLETGSDIECCSEEEDEDEVLITNSPEPPEPIELEDEMQMDDHGQPGKMHPEQDLPHVFKTIQKALTDLNKEDLYKFKLNFNLRQSSDLSLKQMFDGDLLDFVDRIIEMFGLEQSLSCTIATLENITKHEEAALLRANCKKALIRFSLMTQFIRDCQFVFEAIPEAGKRARLDDIYIEPEICLCACGGVDSSHEFRSPLQAPIQSPPPGSAVSLVNMFRQQKPDGRPVRTVVTTGLPGIGMSIAVSKYCYDWAEQRANRDFQYVITLPFSSLWNLRDRNPPDEMSMMDVIEYIHSLCKSKTYLDDDECKYLLVMDSFDCYRTPLDWKNTPIINDSHVPAKLDDLIVNLIRGTLLPNAQVWILGRPAAVSQIPSQYVDAFTEIHGFNQEMRDEYMRKHFKPELGNRVVQRYKQLPTLRILTRQPFICWMVDEIFAYNYKKYRDYGQEPPKVTPFYVNTLVVQTNRRLEYYYDQPPMCYNWSKDDQKMLIGLAKMALKMLEQNTFEFSEEDVKHHGLDVRDVTVLSGFCTELPRASSGKRRFSFIHSTFQEFMAALYVFTLFREESKNALEQSKGTWFTSRQQPVKTSAGLVQSAIDLTFASPRGHYDMFLRFLCGLISIENNRTIGGNLYERLPFKDQALYSPEVKELLRKTIQTCPADRKENLEECLREMTQFYN
uniref:NLR family, CARD domain containing 3-like n=1 Tax=Neogobius melanostomus TaxID=47308 RepID=A0A8C6TXP1_9GOBI